MNPQDMGSPSADRAEDFEANIWSLMERQDSGKRAMNSRQEGSMGLNQMSLYRREWVVM